MFFAYIRICSEVRGKYLFLPILLIAVAWSHNSDKKQICVSFRGEKFDLCCFSILILA